MGASILTTTKKVLGLSEGYTAFDEDVIMHINATFSILDQLGLGPAGGIFITGAEEEWDQVSLPPNQLNLTKTYVFLKVRMLFDPPTTSFLIGAANDQIKEYEWRLNVMRENVLMETQLEEVET